MALRWMFVDMNAYFASVEQQLRPELRGRPVAVAPLDVETTSCVAVSYEAKKFGVRTGTLVAEARRLCPGLIVVPVRAREYIEIHHQIVAAVDRVLPVHSTLSIDEMCCQLSPRDAPHVRELALEVKDSIREHVGEALKCSIGVAPNRFLAKTASDMQKPDGLTILRREDLPGRLFGLKLMDLPGVGPRMEKRCLRAGVGTVEQLCERTPEQLARIWGGPWIGQVWWCRLHGEDYRDPPTKRRSVSHSKVLAPEERTMTRARAVLMRLVHKVGARMRSIGYWANVVSTSVSYLGRPAWSIRRRLDPVRDTLTLVQTVAEHWRQAPAGTPLKVSVWLDELEPNGQVTGDLFPTNASRPTPHLSAAMDRAAEKFGARALYFGAMHESRQLEGPRIAFQHIPDLSLAEP